MKKFNIVLGHLLILLMVTFITCTKDGDNPSPPSEGIIQDSNAYLFSTELNTRLKGGGLSDSQAKAISDGAYLEARQVVAGRITRTPSDDITLVAPAIVRGAMKKIQEANLSESEKAAAVNIISASPILSMNLRWGSLFGSFRSDLIKNIARSASRSLFPAGFNSYQLISSMSNVIAKSITAGLKDIGLTNAEKALAIEQANFGAVLGIGDIKNDVPDLSSNLPGVISNIVSGSISSLDEAGLTKEQIVYTSKLANAGAIKALDDAGITDAVVVKSIVIESTKSSVGALDETGLTADLIDDAALGITDAAYKSLSDGGISADSISLLEIKTASTDGLSNIDPTLIQGFDSAVASQGINDYTGTYTDPFESSMASSDTTAPQVSTTVPANDAVGVAINSAISVTFSELMDASSINDTNFYLSGGGSNIAGIFSFNGTSVTFTPTGNLSYSTVFTATITTGVKDLAGNALAANYVWSFTTGVASDTTAPTVSLTSPVNNAVGVFLNKVITAIFSEPMNSTSVNATTFLVSPGYGDISGTVDYSANFATFSPQSALSPSTTYNVRLTTGAKDLAGNALASNYLWSFTTGVFSLIGGTAQGAALSPTGSVDTFAGSAMVAGSADGFGSAAKFNEPSGLATDGINLFVADAGNHAIRKINLATGEVTTLAGLFGVMGSADGFGSAARFTFPLSLTTDGSYIFVVDAGNHIIRKIIIATGEVTTFAGLAEASGTTDGIGIGARFNLPSAITMDNTNLYVAEEDNHTIRKIAMTTAEVITIAGSPGLSGTIDGIGAAARFLRPRGITTDGVNLFISDMDNHTIRKIVLASNTVTTFAGIAGSQGSGDGIFSSATFTFPRQLIMDGTYLYVTDSLHTIRKIELLTTTPLVSTPFGLAGVSGTTDAIGTNARFYQPQGIASDGSKLYIADTYNHTIRRIQ